MPASRPDVLTSPVGHRVGRSWTFAAVLGGLTVALAASVAAAVAIGAVAVPLGRVVEVVAHHALGRAPGREVTPAQDQIVWGLRLPRVLLGACVGAGLAVVGTVLQALVRNPLADPYVFGISSGASVGASAVIVLGVTVAGPYSLSLAAFAGALLAFVLVMLLAGASAGLAPARLILAGVAVAYTMSAFTSAILYFSAGQQGDAGKAQQVMFWLLGGLAGASWGDLMVPAVVVTAGTLVLGLQARPLNALLVGEETAATLGVDLVRFRRRLFTLCALITGVVVAVSGGIGFVGLMLPHLVRSLVGPDHRRVLPATALLGAVFLVWADVLARTAAAPQEIPIGVVTALFGTPFFALVIRAQRPPVGAGE